MDQFFYSPALKNFWKGLCITDFIIFLTKKEFIYILQYGTFNYSHSYHLTDKIRNKTDKGNYPYGIFVGFQRAFDTVNHHILL